MTSWVPVPDGSDFPVTNLPYGVFRGQTGPRIGAAIGEHILDLTGAAERGLLAGPTSMLRTGSLNAFMAAGPAQWSRVRVTVATLLRDETARGRVEPLLVRQADVRMAMPFEVADYVDFYSSKDHATNVGRIFRPDAEALLPNWSHLPIGYHGRAGTVLVSGTDVVRPRGQRRPNPGDEVPGFGPSTKLDFECEVGFVVGRASERGTSVRLSEARDFIFGVVLLNDWSARDIQAWEYVPLGPFLGKSFATSISAWVVPLEAFDAAVVPLPRQRPAPLPYLSGDGASLFGLDLRLEVAVNDVVVSSPEYQYMYWSPAQMLAHLTINGASLRVGDLFASGTVSGWQRDTFGSLLELTWNGTEPIALGDGQRRGFLEDGDVVRLTGWAPGPNGSRVTLGEVAGRILPARE
ncbi:MAG: fumarylacetoacetase [Geodermatophilaceae bacterium]|nr:fumarylacetoacetase [Geodermatophilaceae bacterium]